MKCPHCGSEISFSKVCPICNKRISYGGNTEFYASAHSGSLSYSEIFTDVFKRHSQGDALRTLNARPSQDMDMLKEWKKPWLFARLFAVLSLLSFVLAAMEMYRPEIVYPLSLVISLIIPFTIAVFIWEMDIHRNITILDFLILLFIGGGVACILGMLANEWFDGILMSILHITDRNKIAWSAGLTEESAKLIVCLGFILLTQNKKRFYGLDGLALGVAVAAGFAFWENFGYANDYGIMMNTAIDRTVRGIFGSHMLYTAPFVGALCYSMNGKKLRKADFGNPLFITMFALGVLCHMANNSIDDIVTQSKEIYTILGFLVFPIRIGVTEVYVYNILLGIPAWGSLLFMLRKSINQALEVNDLNEIIRNNRAVHQDGFMLVGKSGTFKGSTIPIKNEVTLGRDPASCNLILNAQGVSRTHCSFILDGSWLLVCDHQSTNGTYVNGKRIEAGKNHALKAGDVIRIGKTDEGFEIA